MAIDEETSGPQRVCPSCGKTFSDDQMLFCPQDNSLLTVELVDHYIGKTISHRYQIILQVGEGGWGKVYKARHLGIDRPVAIKILHRQYSFDQEKTKRFHQEAETLGSISNEGIVSVFDFGITELGQPYLVMEWLDGETLADRIKHGGTLSEADTIRIFTEIRLSKSRTIRASFIATCNPPM